MALLIGMLGGAAQFDTWNPADTDASVTLSNGNLRATSTAGSAAYKSSRATFGKSTSKWYFELTYTTLPALSGIIFGVSTLATGTGTYVGSNTISWGIAFNGDKYTNGTNTNVLSSSSQGGYAMVALDIGAGKIWFGLDGTFDGSPSAGTGPSFTGLSGTLYPMISVIGDGVSAASAGTANFGATALRHTAPSGFLPGFFR